jgi:WD40 repeat protein
VAGRIALSAVVLGLVASFGVAQA